ncbi:hypothetical protein CDAR_123851 [Caerostris darwini]|uniref:Uncharacterized protein n=1 Tax=Caerostris darwini TaxID=1538125 RepID=A0AAV4WH58_9ARAC|nr:hypothetical protein CDAR_123851 [Caerostris darwini]
MGSKDGYGVGFCSTLQDEKEGLKTLYHHQDSPKEHSYGFRSQDRADCSFAHKSGTTRYSSTTGTGEIGIIIHQNGIAIAAYGATHGRDHLISNCFKPITVPPWNLPRRPAADPPRVRLLQL